MHGAVSRYTTAAYRHAKVAGLVFGLLRLHHVSSNNMRHACLSCQLLQSHTHDTDKPMKAASGAGSHYSCSSSSRTSREDPAMKLPISRQPAATVDQHQGRSHNSCSNTVALCRFVCTGSYHTLLVAGTAEQVLPTSMMGPAQSQQVS